MKRIAFALGIVGTVGLAGFAVAGKTTAVNCGEMLKARAALPAKMGELLTQVADNLDGHARLMAAHKGSKEAKDEAAAFVELARQHREMAKAMMKTSEAMAKMGAAMKPAPHEMEAMRSPQAVEGMRRQVALEKEMAALMQKNAAEAEQMMKSAPPTAMK